MKKRTVFTREFKLEAVRLLDEGKKPAAKMLGLDFVHLAKERFDLIISKQSLLTGPIDALLQVVRSEVFTMKVDTMGGYDTSATGQFIAQLNTASFL